jgi:hypothetical protein
MRDGLTPTAAAPAVLARSALLAARARSTLLAVLARSALLVVRALTAVRALAAVRALTVTLAAALVLTAALTAALAAAPPSADALQRGMVDDRWVHADEATREAILTEYAKRLRVQVVRVTIQWPKAEPERGQYDEAYLANIESAVIAARRHKIRVMIMVYQTPKWASDQRFWNKPPSPQIEKGYQPFYPIRRTNLADFRRFAEMLAGRFKGRVTWYECWCEPNLANYLYPQQYRGDKHFASRTYARYLQAFYKGIKAGYRRAVVLGGVTGPWGKNNRWSTSPQRFARHLKALRAWRWFNGYSHHPYPVGGIPPAPNKRPRFPQYTVSLYNARTLLRIFPKKQFYFTEYGYTTKAVKVFGGGRVTPARQARYLTMAYRMAKRLPRVRMLLWLQWKDTPPAAGKPSNLGHYFGLRYANGKRKPSWYRYARLYRQ